MPTVGTGERKAGYEIKCALALQRGGSVRARASKHVHVESPNAHTTTVPLCFIDIKPQPPYNCARFEHLLCFDTRPSRTARDALAYHGRAVSAAAIARNLCPTSSDV
eukprot:6202994-Pleurochrysis_carterae.AAC.4